jgi:hypothetical protein
LIVGLQLLIEPCRPDEKYRFSADNRKLPHHRTWLPPAAQDFGAREKKLAKGNVANGRPAVGKYSENGGENDTEITGSATLRECHLNDWMLDIPLDIFAKFVPPKCPNFSELFQRI